MPSSALKNRLFHRTGKLICARGTAGTPGGFAYDNPQFFDELPNATIITDQRFEFKIEKSLDREPNKCEVTITNLAPTTRSDLTTKPLIVTVLAGYDGETHYMFKGDLRFGYNTPKDTEWQTVLQLADGDRAFRHAQVHKSYRKGSSVLSALRDVTKSMGLQLDSRLNVSTDLQVGFASGRALSGRSADELTALLEPYGYTWSIQNGRMQILKDSDLRPGEAFVINESTGMILSPEWQTPDVNTTKNGQLTKAAAKGPKLKLTTLLYPQLVPGAKIQVQSNAIIGTFRIERLTHSGDTWEGDWTTEIEAKPL